MSKTYTNRSNAMRAAKKELGDDAKVGKHFHLNGNGKSWTWAKAGNRAPKGKRSPISQQPQVIKLLKAIDTANGKTVTELMAVLDVTASHTVRGLISRLKTEGFKILRPREGRNVRYKLESRPA